MTSTEICEIIKQCGESGVKHFLYRDLEFVFGESSGLVSAGNIDKNDIEVENTVEITDNVDNDDDRLDADDLEDLRISDPERYEEIMQGDV